MCMTTIKTVLKKLKTMAKPENLKGMAKFGIAIENRLGVSVPDMRKLAKEIGKNHSLAIELWKTNISEAMILASMIDEHDKLTEKQMDDWVKDFNSWDVCDQVCMNLFEKSPSAYKKITEWSKRKEEFVKRAAYALIACIAWHDKKAKDDIFTGLFSIIKYGATDERNFVKKAVNWALRNIGKRNPALNKSAIKLAKEIEKINSKIAKRIASDAIRELSCREL